MAYEVTLVDDTTELVDGADSYQLEGPLTTFYGNDRPRPLDSWSTKVPATGPIASPGSGGDPEVAGWTTQSVEVTAAVRYHPLRRSQAVEQH